MPRSILGLSFLAVILISPLGYAQERSGTSGIGTGDTDKYRRAIVSAKPDPKPPAPEVLKNVSGKQTIVLRAIFRRNGKVTDIKFYKTDPQDMPEETAKALRKLAIDAARQIKFQPAVKDGKAVSMNIQLEYTFDPSAYGAKPERAN
jgi:hypothetical protein